MARITAEDCLEKIPNRFALVRIASERAKQLLDGARVLISDRHDNKSVVTALREIASGHVRFMTEEEIELAKEKEQQARDAAREAVVHRAQAVPMVASDASSGGNDSGDEHKPPTLNGDAPLNGDGASNI